MCGLKVPMDATSFIANILVTTLTIFIAIECAVPQKVHIPLSFGMAIKYNPDYF